MVAVWLRWKDTEQVQETVSLDLLLCSSPSQQGPRIFISCSQCVMGERAKAPTAPSMPASIPFFQEVPTTEVRLRTALGWPAI